MPNLVIKIDVYGIKFEVKNMIYLNRRIWTAITSDKWSEFSGFYKTVNTILYYSFFITSNMPVMKIFILLQHVAT